MPNAIAEAVVTHADESHATKSDLAEAKSELRTESTRTDNDLRGNIARLESKMDSKFAKAEAESKSQS